VNLQTLADFIIVDLEYNVQVAPTSPADRYPLSSISVKRKSLEKRKRLINSRSAIVAAIA
jgi:hypothetical protein